MNAASDEIADYLVDGWAVAGVSTAFSEVQIIFHTVFLRKETSMIAVTIGANHRSKEFFRNAVVLSPKLAAADMAEQAHECRPKLLSRNNERTS